MRSLSGIHDDTRHTKPLLSLRQITRQEKKKRDGNVEKEVPAIARSSPVTSVGIPISPQILS